MLCVLAQPKDATTVKAFPLFLRRKLPDDVIKGFQGQIAYGDESMVVPSGKGDVALANPALSLPRGAARAPPATHAKAWAAANGFLEYRDQLPIPRIDKMGHRSSAFAREAVERSKLPPRRQGSGEMNSDLGVSFELLYLGSLQYG